MGRLTDDRCLGGVEGRAVRFGMELLYCVDRGTVPPQRKERISCSTCCLTTFPGRMRKPNKLAWRKGWSLSAVTGQRRRGFYPSNVEVWMVFCPQVLCNH